MQNLNCRQTWLLKCQKLIRTKKTVTFKLKEGILFSDGSELTAADVKLTFTLLSDPSYDGRFGTKAAIIEGYDDNHTGDAKS
jgi:peptide/nickel transport system substrate-binding protein